MFARVVRWEGGSSDQMRQVAAEVRSRAEGGPPEGLPATGFRVLIDDDGERALSITFYDSAEDMRKGDEVLNAMDPPSGGFGTRKSVELFEVVVDVARS